MFRYIRLTCVLTLAVAALSAQVSPANSVRTTAMIGIADGQTARFNLLNPGVQAPALGIICTAMVQYLDDTGTVLKSVSVSVAPGKSVGVLLHSDTDLSLPVGDRREIRATISMPAVPPPSTTNATGTTAVPACRLVPTLEIFDTVSGRTQVSLGHVANVD